MPDDLIDLSGKDADEILSLFTSLDELADTKRIVVVVWSPEKKGKTHFAMTSSELVPENPTISPELQEMLADGRLVVGTPVFFFDTEGKARKLKYKFAGRDVRILVVRVPDKEHPGKADCFQSMKNLLLGLVAMSRQPCGTVVIDSWSDANRWMRRIIQQKEAEKLGTEVGIFDLTETDWKDYEIRGDVLDFIMFYIQNNIPNMHVILTSRAKKQYKTEWDEKKGKQALHATGKVVKKMWDDTMYYADCEVMLDRTEMSDGKPERTGELITTEYDDEDPITAEWINPTFPKLVDTIKDFIWKRKVVAPYKKPKKAAKKKAKKIVEDPDEAEEDD